MPPSDYLNTCTNIPALPSGWNWYLFSYEETRESYSRPGEYIDWRMFYISIHDANGETLSSAKTGFLIESVERGLNGYLNSDLVRTCYKVYNDLYAENKLDINEALKYA